MINYLKKNKWMIIISALITLTPIIAGVILWPGGSRHTGVDVLVGHLPPLFHDGIAVFISTFARCVNAGCAGVDEMDESVRFLSLALEIVAGDALHRIARPICSDIGEYLSSAC